MFAKINGTRIYFDVEGRELIFDGKSWKKKPICFIIHGGPGGELTGFGSFLTPLSDYMQLIYIDQRGCGRSEKAPRSTYTMDFNVDDLEELRKYLGIEKVVVFGHSYGGMVAQSYATRYPDSIAGLLLIATSPSNYFGKQAKETIELIGTEEQKRLARLLFESKLKTPEQFADFKIEMEPLYLYSTRGKVKTEEEKEAAKQALLKKKVTFSLEVGEEGGKFLDTFDLVEDLHKVTCPTLIVGGRHDWITPIEASICIAENIPNNELVILEKSCHYLFIDEQDNFISTVRSFIKRRVLN
ncbi:alpha/beta fold hydrolase [Psychrobacillus sp. L3]|uniref:alpha/beta fold hydrolase n=1 Tax=Psychrobacillus sp. L3 TaxID=3236891 RepID=UPI0036F1EF65